MKNNRTRKNFALGFLGFLGFLGLGYFKTQDPADLFYLAWFAWFGYFLVAKVTAEAPDERYRENVSKAKETAFWVPLAALFVIGISSGFPIGSREFMILVSALGWAGTILAYAGSLYYYETH